MLIHRLALVAMVAACAICPVADSAEDERALLLRELEEMAARLGSAQAPRDQDAWRRRAIQLADRGAGLPLSPGSHVSLSHADPIGDMLQGLRAWGDPKGPRLPSLEQYRRWLLEFKQAMASAQRLDGSPPTLELIASSRGELCRILEQRAYTDIVEAKSGLLERIAEMLRRYVLDPLFGPKSERARSVVALVALILLALLVGHITWEIWGMLRHTGPRADQKGVGIPGFHALGILSGEELLREGDRARAEGRLLRAIGLYYLSLIFWLAAADCTRLDRTLTNWEHYQAAARSRRMQGDDLHRLAEVNAFFDEHCYGGRPLSGTSVAQFRTSVVRLKDALHATAS